ncbi:hypothetical protein F4777DRAFT_582620 [Nemania sp. FL0916]|nr:hypothetical protein F4777DRAFT_582620 [Nemania sp. FL0916]
MAVDKDNTDKPANAKANANANASMTARAKARGHSLLAYSQRQADRIVSPTTRRKAVDAVTDFAARRPLLSLFIAAQILLSLLPVALFTTFVVFIVVFSVLSLIAFVLFWTGVALLVLVPTLFFTGSIAILVWLWSIGAYLIFRALYGRLPASLRRGSDADKHVIFRQDGKGNGYRYDHKPAFDLDKAIDAEAAEVRE